MKYMSTRANHESVESVQAIYKGMVPRGGLFVPESFPEADLEVWKDLSYADLTYEVLKLYLTDFSEKDLRDSVHEAYGTGAFEKNRIAPMKYLSEDLNILELWHGPTAAFKDLALQLMPRLLHRSAMKLSTGRQLVILVATSGDTGKAALEGFKDIPGIRIIVFYPKHGVSRVQEMQMLSTGGKNTCVVGVEGNFDDCQTKVKHIFGDHAFARELKVNGYEFSSANSINWGRLVPQIVYYFYAYFEMVRAGKLEFGNPFNVVVPTGNFGNILASYYASEMGLPVGHFVCASNKNNVLTDFIESGKYDRKRKFYNTSSPSMDILISSNLERFLYHMVNGKAEKILRWYEDLSKKGIFKVDIATHHRILEKFSGGYSTEAEVFETIRSIFDRDHYVIDPHTAVGVHVYQKYRKETGDQTPTVIDSTASPFKFNKTVYQALFGDTGVKSEFELMQALSKKTDMPIHPSLQGLENRKIRFDTVVSLSKVKSEVREILGL